MADKSKIEWTDATWNPITGCTKVSQGCKHCYAEREVESRWSKNPKSVWYGREFTDVQCHSERLEQPLRWRRPRRIFVNSMSDLFHPNVPDSFLDHVFAVMAHCPDHIFQVLTKRPDRMYHYLSNMYKRPGEIASAGMNVWNGKCWADGDNAWDYVCTRINNGALPNVWMGVSVEDQATANERTPWLIDTPAAIRWVSVEPLLGPVDLENITIIAGEGYRPSVVLDALRGHVKGPDDMLNSGIDWVVVGGESGPHARPMNISWVCDLRDQCITADTPFLLKQWGEWAPALMGTWLDPLDGCVDFRSRAFGKDCHDFGDGYGAVRLGKKHTGRMLDGELHDDYPEVNK